MFPLILVPVSASDVGLLETWVSPFLAVGGAPKAQVLFIPTAMVQSRARQAAEAIKGLCAGVQVIPLERDPKGGWPRASNEHHFWAMVARGKLPDARRTSPFIWMEVDAPPTRPTWYEELHTFYQMECGGHGFAGHIRPRIEDIAPRPRVLPGVTPPPHTPQFLERPDDPYMEGVCIYPGNYEQMVDGMFRGIDGKMGWDERLRHYFKRDWHSTDLIEHHWRTVNYRMEDGKMVCDDGPDNQFGTKHGGIVSDRAAIVHGCKDGSLSRLIVEKHKSEMISLDAFSSKPAPVVFAGAPEAVSKEAPKVPVNPGQAQFTPVGARLPQQPTSGSDPAMAAELARLKAQREGLEQRQQDSAASKIPPLAELKAMIQASTKAPRLADLAKKLGVKDAELKLVLSPPTSGVKIGPGGYIKVAA